MKKINIMKDLPVLLEPVGSIENWPENQPEKITKIGE